MAIPKFDAFFNILLQSLQDGEVHSFSDCKQYIKNHLPLSEADIAETITNGKSKVWNRVGWCKTYLKKAGLVKTPKHSHVCITEEGKRLLEENVLVTLPLLNARYPSFAAFYHPVQDHTATAVETDTVEETIETPQEMFERGYQEIHAALADEILTTIYERSPRFFEQLVVKLLEGMGYGGYEGAGFVTKYSNDHGIDGVIDEDKLGFNRIYVQAKRWAPDKVITRPEIQQFKGALEGPPKIEKGLFVTTASFSEKAKEYAAAQHIILVDGKKLAELMIEFDIGVSTQKTYRLKRIDSDFFDEDE